jgi:hypothetical protein
MDPLATARSPSAGPSPGQLSNRLPRFAQQQTGARPLLEEVSEVWVAARDKATRRAPRRRLHFGLLAREAGAENRPDLIGSAEGRTTGRR